MVVVILGARTSHARNGNIVRIRIESKVLQCLRIMRWVCRVALGQFNHFLIPIGIMIDEALTKGRHMEETVQEIGSPEDIDITFGHVVSQGAHRNERATGSVAQFTDDSLIRRFLISPVSFVACCCQFSWSKGSENVSIVKAHLRFRIFRQDYHI